MANPGSTTQSPRECQTNCKNREVFLHLHFHPAQLEILGSRFYKREGSLLEETIIELTVRNGTVYAISRAVFVGTLVSPGRSIPWNKESFSYQIRGGLEPGEEVTWQLKMGMFSDWDRLDAPGDAILTVEVKSLEGADGRDICVED